MLLQENHQKCILFEYKCQYMDSFIIWIYISTWIWSFKKIVFIFFLYGDARDVGSTHGSERSRGVGIGNPLQYSCLENPMDRGAWQAIAFGVTKSQEWLSDWAAKQTYVLIRSTDWFPDFYNKAMNYWVIQIFLVRKSKFCDGKLTLLPLFTDFS